MKSIYKKSKKRTHFLGAHCLMMFLIIHLIPNRRKLMSQNKYHMSVFKVIENRFLPASMAHFCRQSGSSSNHFLGDVSFKHNQEK